MKITELACTTLALGLGLGIGWLDLHTTEVTLSILALLASGLLMGLLRPRAAWRWVILIIVGLTLMIIFAFATNMQTAEPIQFDLRITLVMSILILLGAYAGRLLSRIIWSR